MHIQKREQTLFDNVTPVTVTSSVDATPIIVTATAHGFSTGDRVLIYGHTTNIAANGIFKITKLTADTFSLQDEFTGVNVTTTGGGAGSGGIAVKAPPIILLSEFRNIILQVNTSGTATTTLKVAGSLGNPASSYSKGPRYDFPNIGATVSPSNPYSFLSIINLALDGSTIQAATGIVASGADINNQYEVNVNAQKYLTVFPVTWSQGAITVKAILVTNA